MKKILTPPNLPGGVQSRILEIPSSKEWLGIFNTALYQTTRYWNYEQVNESDLSPQYVADICYDIFLKYLDSSYTKNDVPFWDDEDAADADADADDIANDPASLVRTGERLDYQRIHRCHVLTWRCCGL
jgi:hypothetical protein